MPHTEPVNTLMTEFRKDIENFAFDDREGVRQLNINIPNSNKQHSYHISRKGNEITVKMRIER